MSDELNFESLDLVTVPVTVGKRKFTLREAGSEEYCKYQDAINNSIVRDKDGKKVSVKGLSEVEPYLISMCLIENTPEGGLQSVSLEEIKRWPGKVVSKIFKTLARISEIEQEVDEAFLLKQKAEIEEKLQALKKGDPAKNEQNG